MEQIKNGHASPLILSAKDVEIKFSLRGKTLTAVRGASLDLYEGETLAIVGESGCGKSVFTKSFIGMLDKNGSVTGGEILYRGEDLTKYKTEAEWLRVRGKKIAMVFQDPMTSLNPVRTIGEQIAEVIGEHPTVQETASVSDTGHMGSHYAPKTPASVLSTTETFVVPGVSATTTSIALISPTVISSNVIFWM